MDTSSYDGCPRRRRRRRFSDQHRPGLRHDVLLALLLVHGLGSVAFATLQEKPLLFHGSLLRREAAESGPENEKVHAAQTAPQHPGLFSGPR